MTELRERIYQRTGFSNVELDAVMALVGQIERERDEARASVEHLRGDYRRIRKDRDRLLLAWRSARRRANAWRAAATTEIPRWDEDAVVRRFGFLQSDQCGKCGEVNPRLTEALWLHAEAVWQRGQADAEAVLRQATLKGLTVEEGAAVLELGPPRELVIAWVDAARKMLGDAENYSETRIDFPRESFSMEIKAAGEVERYVFTVQRAGRLTPHEARSRAEADRDAERESRFRWAEEAAELETQRDEARHLAAQVVALIANGEHGHPGYEARRSCWVRLDTIARWQAARRSWRPATVEAAPTAGIALADELWPEPCAECETTGRNCSAHARAAGVSGTGTEAHDAQ